MKRFALSLSILAATAVSASAADLPAKVYTKAPPPIVAPVYNWTGCFIGGNGGGLWVRKTWYRTTTQTLDGSHDADGGMGGVQGGCDYQYTNWVFGLQGDYDWTSANGSSLDLATPLFQQFDESHIRGVGSVTGRVGYAINTFLIYGRGGVAWERDRYDIYNGFGGLLTLTTTQPGLTTFVGNNTRDGWTVGVGGEYAFWTSGSQSASAFLEYDHYDFGTKTIGLTSTLTGNVQNYDIRERKDVVKAGLNWRFNFLQPVVAKY